MKYYLAYGSNLNMEQMARRCPGAEAVGTALVKDYELVFRRGFLTIEPKEWSSVPVGIWKISPENESSLDRYEGYPVFYTKEDMPITFTRFRYDGEEYEQTHDCLIYIMNDGYPLQVPSDHYFYTVMIGYRDFGLDRAPLIAAYEKVKWGDEE